MRRIGLALGFVLLACTRLNPAFDQLEVGDDDESGDGDPGDGDPGDGDPGDGDPGDGDPGDGDPGDGDPGDGDPGDGDPGDGDPGDGDGDTNDECDGVLLDEPYDALTTLGALIVETDNAPGFALQGPDCQILTICVSDQPVCDSQSPFLVRLGS
ncbi:MAG TPA: hypothetical protein VK034_27890, partial [Enhygromyxa sp.]|nr:hypothetical protein [Enhygromyxa sp.]